MSLKRRPDLSKQRTKKMKIIDKAKEWRAQGYTYQEIANALHVSIMTSWSYCHDVPKGNVFKKEVKS